MTDKTENSLKLFIVLSRAYRSINDHMNKHIHKHYEPDGICGA